MGTLAVMRYPTKLFANAADHTYVMCGTGAKAWGCWGGKSGGTLLRQGQGSTKRADAIAGPDERAGIKCYLINGVCHQAANRILIAANITVMGARGYGVSEAMFGPYGRTSGPLGTCQSPFEQHPGVSGDLPECTDTDASRQLLSAMGLQPEEERAGEQEYLKEVLRTYDKARPMFEAAHALTHSDREGFQLELFMLKTRYNLGSGLDEGLADRLRTIRLSSERSRMKIEDSFTGDEMEPSEFVQAFNDETLRFQAEVAETVDDRQYGALFGLKRDERVVLADPDIVEMVYGNKQEPLGAQ